MQRSLYAPPNPRYAFTFVFLSICFLLVPLFWSPIQQQAITPLASQTPRRVSDLTQPRQPGPQLNQLESPAPSPAVVAAAPRRHDPIVDFSAQIRRIVLSLLVTCLLVVVTLKALQSKLPGLAGRKQSFLNILAREVIGPNQSIALIQVGPKVLVVGLGDGHMTTLCELTQSELAEALPPAPAPGTPTNLHASVLKHYLSIVPGMGAKSS
jgi:flagellar biogenesis protein FliO